MALTDKEIAQKIIDEWTPEHRTKGVTSMEKNGITCSPTDPRSYKRCIVGEIARVCGFDLQGNNEDFTRFQNRLEKLYYNNDVIYLNDSVYGGQEMILDGLKHLVAEDGE